MKEQLRRYAISRLGDERRTSNRNEAPGSVTVVNYHGVAPENRQRFEEQLHLLMERWRIGDPQELREGASSTPTSGDASLFLTFDDGLRSHIEVAGEVLRDLGLRAICFLPVLPQECGDSTQAWALAEAMRLDVKTELRFERPTGSWAEWRGLSEVFEYGSHTLSHRRLTPKTPQSVVIAEVRDSKSWLEDRLGVGVWSYAWVGGELRNYHRDSLTAGIEAGYERVFATGHASCGRPLDFILQRFHLDPCMSVEETRARLSPSWSRSYWLKRQRMLKRLDSTAGPGQAIT